ncbi:hypothetical protein [Actinospongicola halichondriae]|uniref:hypothetical protein n=1 Tax=Actinospongicola halichondriae TaxID=3236844 RepID=UPI003D50D617
MLKIRIRTKLAAALAVPLVALVAVSGFEAVQASDDADAVRSEAELATVAIGPSSLTTELQNERNFTAIDLIGLSGSATLEVSSVEEGRERVDTAIADLETYLQGRRDVVGDAFAPAFEVLESELDATRALYDDFDGEKGLANQELADELFEQFTVMTTAFFDATQSIATGIDDNALRNGSELVDQGNRRGELLASITRIIVLDTLTEGNEDGYRAQAAGQIERVRATEERIEQLSVGPYADVRGDHTRPRVGRRDARLLLRLPRRRTRRPHGAPRGRERWWRRRCDVEWRDGDRDPRFRGRAAHGRRRRAQEPVPDAGGCRGHARGPLQLAREPLDHPPAAPAPGRGARDGIDSSAGCPAADPRDPTR